MRHVSTTKRQHGDRPVAAVSSLDRAQQFTMQATMTPAMPSQRASLQAALRLFAGIAVRMGHDDTPLPPRYLTGSRRSSDECADSQQRRVKWLPKR